MDLSGTAVVILTSFLSIPIMYCVNLVPNLAEHPFCILLVGATVLAFVFAIPFLYELKSQKKRGSMYIVWSIFTFAAIVDFTIGLENEGIAHNFMMFYVLGGEPYLKTSHGTIINFYDGTIHFFMYYIILQAIDEGRSYRYIGLYWAGSITNSVIVLFCGSVLSHFGVTWSVLLNIPYLLVPVWVAYKLLSTPNSYKFKIQKSSIFSRPLEFCFVVYFIFSTAVIIFKAVATLGCRAEITKLYVKEYEPYLVDPVAFPKVQIMEYLFYFVPFNIFVIYCLVVPGTNRQWILNWSPIYAGASLNGQISFMVAQLHHHLDKASRLPDSQEAKLVFWIVNLTLMIVPQLFDQYCHKISQSTSTEIKSEKEISSNENGSRSQNTYNLRRRSLRNKHIQVVDF